MQKRKIGILTFSDGRKFAHDLQYEMNKGFQDKLVKVLEKTGEIEVRPLRDHLDAGAGPHRGEETGGGRGGGDDPQLRHLGLPAPAGHRHRVRPGPVPLPVQREPPGARSGGHAGSGGQPEPDRRVPRTGVRERGRIPRSSSR